MKYYKLSMDMERENDIICHYQKDYGIQQNALNTGNVTRRIIVPTYGSFTAD